MFKKQWVRLWAVISAVWMFGVIVVAVYYVSTPDTCFRIVGISFAQNLPPIDDQLAEYEAKAAMTQTYCGRKQQQALLAVEKIARQGFITQIELQWLESTEWSNDNNDHIVTLNGNEITAEKMISHASLLIHKMRWLYVLPNILAAIALIPLALAIGFGVAWSRKGE